MMAGIRKLIIVRLVAAWLGTSLLFSAAAYFYQKNTVEEKVLKLALDEIGSFRDRTLEDAFAGNSTALNTIRERVNQLTRGHFSLIDIYDQNQTHIISAVRAEDETIQTALDARNHRFPLDQHAYSEHFLVDKKWFLQVLLPIHGQHGVTGYYEAIYRVSEETQQSIKAQIFQIQMLVILAVTLTSLALYPVVVALSRRLLSFSYDLVNANLNLLKVLGSAISVRDTTTSAHNYRVTLYSINLAETIRLPPEQIRDLISGAFLHDVGKIGIRDAVLQKPGKLDEAETEHMRQHVSLGIAIVSHSTWLSGAKNVIQYHHERYDGTGYQQQLRGEEIPVEARIFSIADVFDALTTTRPYKSAWPISNVFVEMRNESGKHFDPVLLETFLANATKWYELISSANDNKLEELLRNKVENYFFVSSKNSVDLPPADKAT